MRKADLPYAEVGLFRALACSSTAIHHLSTTYPLRYPQPVDELHPCSFPPNVENHVDKWWISGVSRVYLVHNFGLGYIATAREQLYTRVIHCNKPNNTVTFLVIHISYPQSYALFYTLVHKSPLWITHYRG